MRTRMRIKKLERQFQARQNNPKQNIYRNRRADPVRKSSKRAMKQAHTHTHTHVEGFPGRQEGPLYRVPRSCKRRLLASLAAMQHRAEPSSFITTSSRTELWQMQMNHANTYIPVQHNTKSCSSLSLARTTCTTCTSIMIDNVTTDSRNPYRTSFRGIMGSEPFHSALPTP